MEASKSSVKAGFLTVWAAGPGFSGLLGNLSRSLIPPTAVLLPHLGTSSLPPMSNYMGVKSFSVPTLRQDKTHVTPMADSCQCMAKTTTIL